MSRFNYICLVKIPLTPHLVPYTTTPFTTLTYNPPSHIRVSCPESYFLSESLYAPENMLVNTHPLKLFVVTLDADTDITQQRVQGNAISV